MVNGGELTRDHANISLRGHLAFCKVTEGALDDTLQLRCGQITCLAPLVRPAISITCRRTDRKEVGSGQKDWVPGVFFGIHEYRKGSGGS